MVGIIFGFSLKEQAVSPLTAMPGHQTNQQSIAPQQQNQAGQNAPGQQQAQTPQSQQNAASQSVQSGQSPQQNSSLQIPPMSSPSTNVGSPMGSSTAGGPFRQNAGGPQVIFVLHTLFLGGSVLNGPCLCLALYRPAMPFGNRKIYFRGSFQFSIFTIFKKCHPLEI